LPYIANRVSLNLNGFQTVTGKSICFCDRGKLAAKPGASEEASRRASKLGLAAWGASARAAKPSLVAAQRLQLVFAARALGAAGIEQAEQLSAEGILSNKEKRARTTDKGGAEDAENGEGAQL
jgi:hypothetical protein